MACRVTLTVMVGVWGNLIAFQPPCSSSAFEEASIIKRLLLLS